jgi:hypothetical protein
MNAPSAQSTSLAPGFSRAVVVDEPSCASAPSIGRSRELCAELESGNIVLLPRSPILIPDEDRDLLFGRKQARSPYHKNIAYRPTEDRITGVSGAAQAESEQLRRVLRDYSRRVREFLSNLLAPYAGNWRVDYASYRPIEEKARPARLHARNDLLHFDSFPTRPTNGARILRFFTNINPSENRVWVTSQTFEAFGPRFALAAGLTNSSTTEAFTRRLRSFAHTIGLAAFSRPPYDEFMQRCHNLMKEDTNFQENTPKQRWEFAPNSSWLVFTDCVSHAVLSGQYALEQTFLIPPNALVESKHAPLAILEKIAGRRLTF